MENNVFRSNVFKTLSVKPAKAGLKYVARDTHRVNVMHAAIGLSTEANELLECMSPYILGYERLTEKMKVHAFEEMGDIGYYMVVLAKQLKVKLPASSKKSRLKDTTRSTAVLELVRISSALANLSKKVFYGPVTNEVERDKTVIQKNEDGSDGDTTTVQVKAEVIDADKTTEMFAARDAKAVELLGELIPLYWSLCFDMFEVPPSNVFVGNIAKLSKRYGEGFFQLSEAEHRDIEEEQQALVTA